MFNFWICLHARPVFCFIGLIVNPEEVKEVDTRFCGRLPKLQKDVLAAEWTQMMLLLLFFVTPWAQFQPEQQEEKSLIHFRIWNQTATTILRVKPNRRSGETHLATQDFV